MSLLSPSDALSLAQKPGVLFVDTRPVSAWSDATIPGAVQLEAYKYFIRESTEDGIRAMVAGLRNAFAAIGVDKAHTVIFFEEATGMISPRALWFHELCGLPGGHILDGGISGWRQAGGETVAGRGVTTGISDGDPAAAGQFRRDLVTTTAQAREAQANPRLIDTRDPEEWDGSFTHACCKRAGRLPHSEHLFYADLLLDQRYRSPAELAQIAKAHGLDAQDDIIVYCHRGARAATVLYALREAGFDNLAIYTGGWHEWSADETLPIVAGP